MEVTTGQHIDNPEAPYGLLPRCVPLLVAAKLAGLSPATFRVACLDTGKVKAEQGGIVLSSLAYHLGRLIDIKDFLRAQRSLDPRREQQREYIAKKRGMRRPY